MNKRIKNRIAGLFMIFMTALTASAASYLNEDFDGIALGNYDEATASVSAIGGSWWGAGTETEVVINKLSSDAGDHALYLDGTSNKGDIIFAGDAVAAGQFSVDVEYSYQSFIRIEGAGTPGIYLMLLKTGIYNGLALNDGSTWLIFDNDVAASTAHSLVIDFDCDTDTFTGTVDGLDLKIGATTTFAFTNVKDEFNDIEFNNASTGRHMWADNISLAPKPATIGLFAISGLIMP